MCACRRHMCLSYVAHCRSRPSRRRLSGITQTVTGSGAPAACQSPSPRRPRRRWHANSSSADPEAVPEPLRRRCRSLQPQLASTAGIVHSIGGPPASLAGWLAGPAVYTMSGSGRGIPPHAKGGGWYHTVYLWITRVLKFEWWLNGTPVESPPVQLCTVMACRPSFSSLGLHRDYASGVSLTGMHDGWHVAIAIRTLDPLYLSDFACVVLLGFRIAVPWTISSIVPICPQSD